ncbi:MAG: DUF3365 domain-containing protein [Gemmatimonadota bacterium]|nr:DUF3365 domain-containing protein [Gemmatimonadota bacterium]MDH3368339.1 DUF3365 domain-containing protein [Gemmatimonadota bacterium]MDH3479435.1 DUF3365 domain-containing protein [Gemmatimonadota bacterium]MDH3568810.1 DUF3365 domain-containing protein [Gemmatimonadota bacterium]MDH5550045.1 DUF3365 domain-containing protein [Gemmatimonadota bacterium]
MLDTMLGGSLEQGSLPQDAATGYHLGDLRGGITVRIPLVAREN